MKANLNHKSKPNLKGRTEKVLTVFSSLHRPSGIKPLPIHEFNQITLVNQNNPRKMQKPFARIPALKLNECARSNTSSLNKRKATTVHTSTARSFTKASTFDDNHTGVNEVVRTMGDI